MFLQILILILILLFPLFARFLIQTKMPLFSTMNPPASPVYVPSQLDDSTVSKRALQQSPIHLFLRDTLVLFKLLRYFPWLFLPRPVKNGKVKPYANGPSPREIAIQCLLFFLELILVIAFIPAYIVLPGGIFLLALASSFLLIRLVAWPLAGPRIVSSNGTTSIKQDNHSNESWIFINGCGAGNATLQRDVDCLAYVFGRRVIGIHNRTYGLMADTFECLVQRAFSYNTTDVRISYEYIKLAVCDPRISRIVLVGHSQGGIVISMVIDQLFNELPASLINKIEIYTFGSAASHFSNVPISREPASTRKLDSPWRQLVIPFIEQ